MGLCTGDAYGNQFFNPKNWGDRYIPPQDQTPAYPDGHTEEFVAAQLVPPRQWPWHEGSQMACGILVHLRDNGAVESDTLLQLWTDHFERLESYGPHTDLVTNVRGGGDWNVLTGDALAGAGSQGHGAAARTAPLGAWFADNLELAAQQAQLAAELTHLHADGVAGAVAVAVAAALAARHDTPSPAEFIATVVDKTPDSAVRELLRSVRSYAGTTEQLVARVGNGSDARAEDTVPLCVWVAAHHLDDYPKAVRTVVSVGGDMDVTAAIVGGIVAGGAPANGPPPQWLRQREPLPEWCEIPALRCRLGVRGRCLTELRAGFGAGGEGFFPFAGGFRQGATPGTLIQQVHVHTAIQVVGFVLEAAGKES